ncbi:hypothetical protein K1719_026835 [Acacia pycnantha]|nr:hypothetical protein K1719_026835 [Acacia pycnantha]
MAMTRKWESGLVEEERSRTYVKKPWESGPSFAEKLQGLSKFEIVDASIADVNVLSDDPLSDSDHIESKQDDHEPLCVISEDPNMNFPTFTFSERMKKRLYKAWNRAVIVKLLGRDIGYKLLLSILQPLWAKRGVINLINIGNGFFIVKFTNNDDYRNALTGGPWMIFDHYLTIRPWEPMFHPMRATINKVVVWKVVSKPRRQQRGGKEKSSSEIQRSNGGSRFWGRTVMTLGAIKRSLRWLSFLVDLLKLAVLLRWELLRRKVVVSRRMGKNLQKLFDDDGDGESNLQPVGENQGHKPIAESEVTQYL